jgi:hypothetical protein
MDGSSVVQWLQGLLFGSRQGAQLLSVMIADPGFGAPPSLETIAVLSLGIFLGSIAMVSIRNYQQAGIGNIHMDKSCLNFKQNTAAGSPALQVIIQFYQHSAVQQCHCTVCSVCSNSASDKRTLPS